MFQQQKFKKKSWILNENTTEKDEFSTKPIQKHINQKEWLVNKIADFSTKY